jgi:hypothetical protein
LRVNTRTTYIFFVLHDFSPLYVVLKKEPEREGEEELSGYKKGRGRDFYGKGLTPVYPKLP